MDALTHALDTVRMHTAVFCTAELHAPWSLRSRPLAFGIFHAIVSGGAWAAVDGAEPVFLEAGDAVVIPHGSGHVMAHDLDLRPRDMATIEPDKGQGLVDTLRVDGGGDHTRLFCGRFALQSSVVHPLFSELPTAIVMRSHAGLLSWLSSSIDLIDRELRAGGPGAESLVARLGEVLVLEAIRSHVVSGAPHVGWLRGLADPDVAAVIALVHDRPAEPWTAASLAREVGVSRATLFRRFESLVGMSPGAYLTLWRMHRATQLLRGNGLTVAATAQQVGYRSEASFSQAFLAAIGERPGAFRRNGERRSA